MANIDDMAHSEPMEDDMPSCNTGNNHAVLARQFGVADDSPAMNTSVGNFPGFKNMPRLVRFCLRRRLAGGWRSQWREMTLRELKALSEPELKTLLTHKDYRFDQAHLDQVMFFREYPMMPMYQVA